MKHLNLILYAITRVVSCIAILVMLLTACNSRNKVIDKAGVKCSEMIEISGTIKGAEDNIPLKDAIITNNRTGKSVVSDSLGRFFALCENGDSLRISFVGCITQNIPVNTEDSTKWRVSMLEYGPLISPPLQKSYSTNSDLIMTISNLDQLKMPVDSIVVEMKNNSDKEATYGEWYRLEKKINDKWVRVPYNDKIQRMIENEGVELVFNDIGYVVSPHKEARYVNSTKAYNETITPGRYRLSKKFSYPPYPIEKSDTAYVEFEIR